MTLTYLAGAVALFFAMNIGASGAAASVSVAYGSGAISNRKKLFCCAELPFLLVLSWVEVKLRKRLVLILSRNRS